MINSSVSIRNRTYFLYNTDRSAYRMVLYTETLFAPPVSHPTNKQVTLLEIKTIMGKKSMVTAFTDQMLPIERHFWDHATEEMKQALFYSYYRHHYLGEKKIPNVEIHSWMNIPFFVHHRELERKNAKLTRIRKPRTMLNALISLQGKHQFNLRMGHIHMTKDMIGEKEIWGVHWDYGLAIASFSIIRHWLFDDMPS